jgi:hypothetical protein
MATKKSPNQVIQAIQRSYYLHPDDIAARSRDPDGMETCRQEETIKDRENILELYSSLNLL